MNYDPLIGSLLRVIVPSVFTAIGMAGVFTDAEVQQLSGALGIIISLGWAGYANYTRNRG